MTDTRKWKDWMWLVKTRKGDFFITVCGDWTQEEAAVKVQVLFEDLLLADGKFIGITGMIPRKRFTGQDDMHGTISQQLERKNESGFDFYAGKKFWDVCARTADYQAQMILFNKKLEEGAADNDQPSKSAAPWS